MVRTADGEISAEGDGCRLAGCARNDHAPTEYLDVDSIVPRTTLLVLVHTFGGEELIARAYQEAIREGSFWSISHAMFAPQS